jgi:hypothetical protein
METAEKIPVEIFIKKYVPSDISTSQELEYQNSFFAKKETNKLLNPYFTVFKQRIQNVVFQNLQYVEQYFSAYFGKQNESVNTVDDIFGSLYRVFESENSVRNYKIINDTNDSKKEKINDHLTKIDFWRFWQTEFWDALRTQTQGYMIVDSKENIEEPYIYIISVHQLLAVQFDDNSDIKGIAFTVKTDGTDFIHWYTDEFYSVWKSENGKMIEAFPTQYHKLQLCPAVPIGFGKLNAEAIATQNTILFPIYEKLFRLDHITTEYFKLGCSILSPDKIQPKTSCGYADANGSCDGGRINYTITSGTPDSPINTTMVKLCPKCGTQHMVGHGRVHFIDYTQLGDGIKLPDKIVDYVQAPIDGYTAMGETIEKLKSEIINSIVGIENQATASAINEKQVISGVESKTTILTRIGDFIAEKQTKVLTIMINCIIGANNIESITISNGNKFYLTSEKELYENIQISEGVVDKMIATEQFINTKFKNMPEMKLRVELLNNYLLPYSYLSDTDFQAAVTAGVITDRVLIELRINFSAYIFEYELTKKNKSTEQFRNCETEKRSISIS